MGLYCKIGVLAWNCITIQFIVLQEKAGKAGVVSQYTEVYCDCGAKARLDCIVIQCPAKPRYSQEARRRWGALGAQQAQAGRAGGMGAGERGRSAAGVTAGGASGRVGCTATQQPCAATQPGSSATTRPGRPQHGHPRAACAHRLGQLGARAPGLVFNLGFRLGIFPESLNEHCSL